MHWGQTFTINTLDLYIVMNTIVQRKVVFVPDLYFRALALTI